MKRSLFVIGFIAFALAAKAGISAGILPLGATLPMITHAPHVVLTHAGDKTQVDMALPQTLGATNTQRLSKEVTYNEECTLEKDGLPVFTKRTITYPRVEATITRVSANNVSINWKSKDIAFMASYTEGACSVQAPVWTVDTGTHNVDLNNHTPENIKGWLLKLSTQSPPIGDQP